MFFPLCKIVNKFIRISKFSGLVIFLLMKKAYQYYHKTKPLISIERIAMKHHNPCTLFTSQEFKTIEAIVNSEELPIVMFLTNLKKTHTETPNPTNSKNQIALREFSNIFKIQLPPQEFNRLITSHIQAVLNRRSMTTSPKLVLKYCLDLMDILDLDAHFDVNIAKGRVYEDNETHIWRVKATDAQLRDELIRRGFCFN